MAQLHITKGSKGVLFQVLTSIKYRRMVDGNVVIDKYETMFVIFSHYLKRSTPIFDRLYVYYLKLSEQHAGLPADQ